MSFIQGSSSNQNPKTLGGSSSQSRSPNIRGSSSRSLSPHVRLSSSNSSSSQKQSSKNVRGILRSGKPDNDEGHRASFDEMNILATYHPANKDYGMMKIDEPKTPFNRTDAEPSQPISAEALSRHLSGSEERNSSFRHSISNDHSSSADDLKHSKEFEQHRKQHYNMKEQLRRGKELATKELAELD